jgi:hypothetical protein
MLPDHPLLVLCPHCGSPVWIEELEVVGRISPWQGGEEKFWEAARFHALPGKDYFALLTKKFTTPEKERYVRIRAWWAGNDVRRAAGKESPLSSSEVSNLGALTKLLDESDAGDLLMKAEVMRELGRFEDSLALLEKCVDESLLRAAAAIRKLAEDGDPYVREIHV